MISIRVPYDFVSSLTELTWQEARLGVALGLFESSNCIDLAADRLGRGDSSTALAQLAGSEEGEPVLRMVEDLAGSEPDQPLSTMRRKWVFLAFSWLFERRDLLEDALGLAEMLYADLDYPEEVVPFIRYMPSDEPSLGNRELNEERLLQRWARYVHTERLLHCPQE